MSVTETEKAKFMYILKICCILSFATKERIVMACIFFSFYLQSECFGHLVSAEPFKLIWSTC